MQRTGYAKLVPALAGKLLELSDLVGRSSIERSLLHLVYVRASQINGCTFCVDMHVKEAKLDGERELRLHHVAVWRESRLFSERERAALEWAEALTRLAERGVPDALYERVRAQLSEVELAELAFAVCGINSWNRLSVAFRSEPGSLDAALGLDKAGLS